VIVGLDLASPFVKQLTSLSFLSFSVFNSIRDTAVLRPYHRTYRSITSVRRTYWVEAIR
jgi:hypothetical protein